VYTQKKNWCRTTMINKISLFLNFIIYYNEAVNYWHRSQMLCSAAGCLIRVNWHNRSCHSICGPTYYTTLQNIVQPANMAKRPDNLAYLFNVMVFNKAQQSYIRTGDILLTLQRVRVISVAMKHNELPFNWATYVAVNTTNLLGADMKSQ